MGPGTKYSKIQLSRVDGKFSLQELTYLRKRETPIDGPLETFAASSLRETSVFVLFHWANTSMG